MSADEEKHVYRVGSGVCSDDGEESVIFYRFDEFENSIVIYDQAEYLSFKADHEYEFYEDIMLQISLGIQNVSIIKNILGQIKVNGNIDTQKIISDSRVKPGSFNFNMFVYILNELEYRGFVIENTGWVLNEIGECIKKNDSPPFGLQEKGMSFLENVEDIDWNSWSEEKLNVLIESYIKDGEVKVGLENA